jgi:hypothetical protein
MTFAVALRADAPQYRAHFRLPFTVTWAGRQLPAGEYNVTSPAGFSGVLAITPANGGRSLFVLGQRGELPTQAAGELLIETIGERHVVHILRLPAAGAEMIYAMPKPTSREREVKKVAPTKVPVVGG